MAMYSDPWDNYQIAEYYDGNITPYGKIIYSDNTTEPSDVPFIGRPYSGLVYVSSQRIDLGDIEGRKQPWELHYVSSNCGENDTIKIKWEINSGANQNLVLLSGEFNFDLANLHNCRSGEDRTNAIKNAIKEQVIKAIDELGTITFAIGK